MALGACSLPAGVFPPSVPLPTAFAESGAAPLPERWWTSFDDPVLDGLVDAALRDNRGLAATGARLRQARATARKQGAARVPAIDAEAGVSGALQRSRTAATVAEAWTVERTPDFDLGLSTTYEVDLWDRVAAATDAAALDATASAEDLRAAAISLAAEVAGTWYALVERYGQIDLLHRQLDVDRQVLDLIDLRFRRGQGSATDVLQQRQVVESVLGDLASAEAEAAASGHALAVLLGQAPGGPDIPRVVDLPPLPPLPATGVPADLVTRRPDLRRAHAELLAADRRVAAAVADRFPKLSLTAGVGTSAENIKDLFDNWLASLAANLVAPLFDAGSRAAEVERTRAVVDEALALYGQAAIEAVEEVETALVRERQQRAYLLSLERQLALSDEVIRRIRDRYTGGTVTYISVLDALLTHQGLERTYLTAKRQLVDDRIDLCRALAGGWALEGEEK